MKDLLLYYIQAAPVFAYWISLAIIGYALVTFVVDKFKLPSKVKGIEGNAFLSVVLSFAAGVALVSGASLIGYIFNLPSAIFTVVWAVALVASVALLAPRALRRLTSTRMFRLGGVEFWVLLGLFITAIGALILDYLLSTYWGAQFAEGSDSYVHVSKILSIATYGFSLDDGFMEGVLETRYHFNAIYPLYLPIIHLLNIAPADAWNLSAGFFRFIQWIGIGALAGFIYGRITAEKLPVWAFSAYAVVVAISLFTSKWYLHVAAYPNKIVILWFILLLIGFILAVSRIVKERSAGFILMYLSAILTTLTHPTYALMAAVFVLLSTAIMVAGRYMKWWRWSWRETSMAIGTFVILMIAPLIAISFPDRMTQQSFDYGNFKTVEVLGVEVLPIGIPSTLSAALLALTAIVGYVFIVAGLYKKRQYGVIALVSVIIAFPFLTLHNPLFMFIVGDRLPLWLVARFSAMNILMFVSFSFGVYALTVYVRGIRMGRSFRLLILGILSVSVVTGLAISIFTGYKSLRGYTKAIDHGYLAFIQRTQADLDGVIPEGSLVYANIGDSYFLPAVIPVKVIAIHDAHATPMADSKQRMLCSDAIINSGYDSRMLATAGVEYIVLAKWEVAFDSLKSQLDTRDGEFSFMKETADFFVYKFNGNVQELATKSGACYEYQVNEENI